MHTPGHSPGHICLWNAADRPLCSGDHLLQFVSPPVTFERGFDTDPMGSYLESLDRVALLGPERVLPGHGPPFRDGARSAPISRNKLRRLTQIREMVGARERTVTELTAELFPTVTARERSGTSPWRRSSPTSPITRWAACWSGHGGPTGSSYGDRRESEAGSGYGFVVRGCCDRKSDETGRVP